MINFRVKELAFKPNRLEKYTDKNLRIQAEIDKKVMLRMDPYVPFKSGELKKSVRRASVVGSGLLVYNMPYARRQYYLENRTVKKDKNGNVLDPLRGSRWLDRMKDNEMPDLIKEIKKYAKEVYRGV